VYYLMGLVSSAQYSAGLMHHYLMVRGTDAPATHVVAVSVPAMQT